MSPAQELIDAAIAALKAAPQVNGPVGGRIFDKVPDKPGGKGGEPPPYISLGPTTEIPDDFECIDGVEVTLQFDVWSWGSDDAYSTRQCREIADAVKRTLHNAELPLTENAFVTMQHELTRVLRDPDGVTNHGVVQFTATVETP